MKLSVDKKVFENFHGELFVGAIACFDINNAVASAETEEMLHDMAEYVRLNFNADTLKTHHLVSAWKAATAHYGEKFQHYHTHIEEMIKHILAGKHLSSENKLADLVHFFSLKYIVPLTAIDLKNVGKKLVFTLHSDDTKNELVFRDERAILVRKFAEAKQQHHVTEKTSNALIFVEGVPPLHQEQMSNILEEVASLVKIFCGGKTKRIILTKHKLSAEM
ncbi:MAG TPA: hypothetical protein VJK72_05465 [Candidatus Nanoarchaeia archaeon]|nr:hypothetical protein [Candidatus Nanoarchaeia archaeon]